MLRGVFHGCRRYFLTALIFSLGINLLYLAGPLYMLQLYDRVISSASHVTLVMLTIVLLFAFVALAGLDFVRARVLTRASVRLDREMAGRVLAATVEIVGQGRAADEPDTARFRHLPAVRHRAGHPCHLRSALGADLYLRHFSPASAARRICAGVGDHARCPGRLRPMARAGPDGGVERVGVAQLRLHRHEPAQRRGGAGHGHDARPPPALGQRSQPGHSSGRSSPATARPPMRASFAFCASRCSRSCSGSAPILSSTGWSRSVSCSPPASCSVARCSRSSKSSAPGAI